jgi:hypothetical protein
MRCSCWKSKVKEEDDRWLRFLVFTELIILFQPIFGRCVDSLITILIWSHITTCMIIHFNQGNGSWVGQFRDLETKSNITNTIYFCQVINNSWAFEMHSQSNQYKRKPTWGFTRQSIDLFPSHQPISLLFFFSPSLHEHDQPNLIVSC